MNRLVAVTVAVLSVVLLAACGGGSAAQPSAATVDGSVITRDSLYEDLDAIAGSPTLRESVEIYGETEGSYNMDFINQVLSARIIDSLVRNELDARGLDPTAEDLQQAEEEFDRGFQTAAAELPESFRTRQVETIAARNALTRVLTEEGFAAPTLTEDDLRAYYDENLDEIMAQAGGDVPCISHIMVAFDPATLSATQPTPEQEAAARAEAEALLARIQAGESFGSVAAAESDDPASAAADGDFGCQPGTAQIGEEFDQAMLTQPVGEVGGPVRSDFGYHVLLVRSRGVVPFEEIRDQIEQVLTNERQQQDSSPIATWLSLQVLEADIDVNPLFGSFDAETFLTSGLVPPEGPLAPAGTVPLLVPPS